MKTNQPAAPLAVVETGEQARDRIRRYRMEGRAELEKLLRAHHIVESAGAGGQSICACGESCGTTLACTAYRDLRDAADERDELKRENKALKKENERLKTRLESLRPTIEKGDPLPLDLDEVDLEIFDD